MADLLCENMMNMGHFKPPKIHRTQSTAKKGMSITNLAEIMLEANEDTLFDGLNIEFARKTKGGIAIVDRNTSNEKQIITGSGQEAWPYFADTNPHVPRSQRASGRKIRPFTATKVPFTATTNATRTASDSSSGENFWYILDQFDDL